VTDDLTKTIAKTVSLAVEAQAKAMFLEVNGGAAALSTVRGVIDSALDGRRR